MRGILRVLFSKRYPNRAATFNGPFGLHLEIEVTRNKLRAVDLYWERKDWDGR